MTTKMIQSNRPAALLIDWSYQEKKVMRIRPLEQNKSYGLREAAMSGICGRKYGMHRPDSPTLYLAAVIHQIGYMVLLDGQPASIVRFNSNLYASDALDTYFRLTI
jgi:hypothetical protein